MRVLYFTRDYTPHDHRFLAALAQTEHTVGLLRLERSGRQLEDRPVPPEIEQIQWRGGQRKVQLADSPALLSDLRRVIKSWKPDLIHAGPIPTVSLLAALSGFRPLVSMSWGSDLLRDADQNASTRWAARFALSRTDVLVGDCQAVRDKAAQFGFPPDRAVLFPWGVDLEQFQPGNGSSPLRMRQGWQDCFTLLSLRSWEPVYGVDGVARAFVQAAQVNPDLRLYLLGNGSQAGLIHEILQRGGVIDRVHFGGQVSQPELPDYYQAADLYISASHSDGSSVSLMEALACGLPVLVSDIPTNREWITPGQEGWLFRDGDAQDLAQGIARAVESRAQLSEIGKASRALAERRANWKHNFQELLRAYDLAVKARR